MSQTAAWGIVATIRAPLAGILDFAAWHLDLGADRLFIYLDDAAPDTAAALSTHPRITAIETGDAYWRAQGRRPARHQPRQTANATHAYARAAGLDWLCHIDVDEFLLPGAQPMADRLAALPTGVDIARVRPIEALAPGDADTDGLTAFKAFHLAPGRRQEAAQRVFPTWGPYLSGGFLSHVAGKIFVRTGLPDIEIRIHNAFRNGEMLRNEAELDGVELAHMHARSWEDWRAHLDFRLDRGSYRNELQPPVRNSAEAVNLHTLLSYVLDEQGEDGLRAFYDEVCIANAPLLARLDAEGLLRRHDMALDRIRNKHFPGIVD